MKRGIKAGIPKKIADRPMPITMTENITQSSGNILPELLNVKQVSQLINIPVSTLNKGRMTGTLHGQTPLPHHVKIGKTVRYFRSEVDRWLCELAQQQRADR
jgi:predicted DNA-binding transcriptional regulator AlpA